MAFSTETDEVQFREMMDSPYFATVNTVRAFLDPMIKRGSGHIITINSAAAYFHFAGATGYMAARWALRGFTHALREDLRETNINVSMIVAGKVVSPYFVNNPGSEERIPGIATLLSKTMSVTEVAQVIFKTIMSPRNTVIIPFMMKLSVWLNRFFPALFTFLMRKTGYKGMREEIGWVRNS